MRNAFIAELTKQAEVDEDIVLITGDLGFGVLTDFEKRFPKQFINAGVAEQNMAGMAAGLALEGKKVYTYSIANFPTLRCLEQIRNDICYHDANVTIVAVGGGFAYGQLGMSHHATEDLAILRALPNLNVFAPGDPFETKAVMKYMHEQNAGPNYLRLGRAGEPNVHSGEIKYYHGRAIKVVGSDCEIAIFSTGGMLKTAVDAAEFLNNSGQNVSVYSFPCVKPLDSELIRQVSEKASLILTLEEHSKLGGLGGAVAEVMAEHSKSKAILKRFGLNDTYSCVVGNQDYLKSHYKLDAEAVTQAVQLYVSKEKVFEL